MWIRIAPRRKHTSKALTYSTRSQGISQFYLHTLHSSANGMNHTCLFLPSRSWSSFTDPGGMEGWVGLGGWLHTEINVRHRELNPDTITHPSLNWAQRRLTLLIKTNVLSLWQTTTGSLFIFGYLHWNALSHCHKPVILHCYINQHYIVLHCICLCYSWNIPVPSDYALQFNGNSQQGFVTERVSNLHYD